VTKFICDGCGQPIETIDDGWVEWKTIMNGEHSSQGMRLVHHRKVNRSCAYNEKQLYDIEGAILGDLPLSSFLGDDGLMMLLSFIHDKRFNTDEVLEMIKRLHISGYEQSRLFFDDAIAYGAFEPNTPPNFYSQRDIQSTLDYIKECKE